MERTVEARNITMLPEWEERIDEEIARLNSHHPGIVHHFRVTLAGTKHHRHGLFEISLIASIPGDTVVVKHRGEQVPPLIVRGFDVLDRQLQDYLRRRRGEVKAHEERPAGTIGKLFSVEGYGFILTADGGEVYFHRNAVADAAFDDLDIGDAVIFTEVMGEKGPQATWLKRS